MTTECSWQVDGLHYAGLAWGPEDGVPMLAVHGWMDHAESFAELAPLLEGCRLVAPDLSGQGLSEHRAAHATYNIWDDLPQIARILDSLGWDSCVLLGHSRGANISSLFAAAQPERVRALVLLDSLVPEPTVKSVVETMRAFILDTRKQASRGPRIFPSAAEYVARRVAQGNSRSVAEALAGRALEPTEDGHRLRGDGRMFASSAVKLSREQVEAILAAIPCPVLNLWASDGILSRGSGSAALAEAAERLVPQYERMEIEGDHHAHLDPEAAQVVAGAVLEFLARHRISE